MHEYSLIASLLKQVEEICKENQGEQITEIQVEVGPLSGVEPLLLQSAFGQLAPDTLAANARLHINEVPLLASCRDCDRSFEVAGFHFRCPHCESGETLVTQGDQFQLTSISLSDSHQPAGART